MMVLQLHSAARSETVPGIAAFDGEDGSGRFALWPRAERTVACLSYGLARLRFEDGRIEYLALPGAVLHFVHPELAIATRRLVRSASHADVLRALDDELRREDESLRDVRASVRRLDQELLRRLWALGREGGDARR